MAKEKAKYASKLNQMNPIGKKAPKKEMPNKGTAHSDAKMKKKKK